MKHYIVIRDQLNQIDKIPVTNLERAKKFVANVGKQTFQHKGRKVEVLGLYDENEVKTIELFHHTGPSHYERWVENMKYLKKYRKWPENNR
jgi:hypothetical protein